MSNGADPKNSLERCKYLWQEYEYRHDLIWRLIFKFTTAIVLISIVTYVQVALVRTLGALIIGAPLLAVALACFGLIVMRNELDIFGKIKLRYREWQNQLMSPDNQLHELKEKGSFSKFVKALVELT